MSEIEIDGLDEAADHLASLPAKMRKRAGATVASLSLALRAAILAKLDGEVLHSRTGRLKSSITSSVASTDHGFVATVGVDTGIAPYGPALEYGATLRARLIEIRNAKALSFLVGGRRVFAKEVHFPGARIPERSFLRSSLAEIAPDLRAALAATAADAVQP